MRLVTATFLLCLAALGLAAQSTAVSAQQKAISKKDFEKVNKKAIELLKATSYRITTTSETFSKNEAKPSSVDREVVEFILPDRRHERSESEGIHVKRFKGESIDIGSQSFWRQDDGAWERLPRRENDGPWEWHEHVAPRKGNTERYFSPASVQREGKEAKVVVVIGREKNSQRYFEEPPFTTYKKTQWYDNDGRLLKEQGEIIDGDFVSGRWTHIYEYDPKNIGQIEVPIK